ncbi:MAG TPA: hypothetical protein VIJ51_04355 [Solirubrobacteraceae bacterium]
MPGTISSDEKQSIPRSARLPSTTPEGTREVVTAIAEIAGSVSRERLASHLGKALTGGIARAMGSAKVYGFIATDANKKLIISERGLAFVGDDPSLAKQAEREGLMVTGFGVVIKKLSTRAASEDVIALRLAEDLNIPEPAARDRARLLVKAATAAELAMNGRFHGGAIEDTIAVVGEPGTPKPAGQKPKETKPTPSANIRDGRPVVGANGASTDADTGSGPSAKAAEKTKTPPAPGDEVATVELPSATPESARRVVTALAAHAGPATRERIASRLGTQLAGRLVSSIVAAIRYGFVAETDDGKLEMTDRGHAFIGDDPAAALQAQQHGIMSTGFAATIQQLSTRAVDVDVVAGRLVDDQRLSERSAAERAKVLVKAATAAGIIADGRFDAEGIEDAIEAVGSPSTPDVAVKPRPAPKPVAPRPAAGAAAARNGSKEGGAKTEPPVPFGQAAPAAAAVQVVLQIDASRLTAEEIGAIVRELRATATVSTSGS